MHTLTVAVSGAPPGYVVWSLNAGVDVAQGVSLFIDARNLTDERYAPEFSAVTAARTANTAVFYPGEGRAAFVGLRLAY